MASTAKPDTGGSPPGSILNLDKSHKPFSAQIAEACHILGIKLGEPSSYLLSEEAEERDSRRYGPQEEWALRWLLKNLQSADLQPASPCLDPKAWLLLRELVVYTSPSNVARLLNAHKFSTTLQKSFKWIRGQVDRATDQSISVSYSDAASSSSETVEASTIEGPKKSKKRKRDSLQSSSIRETFEDLELLYTSICSVNKKLEAMIKGLRRSGDFAVEHLKSALRSSPDQAADVLGGSMALASLLLNFERRDRTRVGDLANLHGPGNQKRKAGQLAGVHEACIISVVDIWKSRTIAADDSLGQSSYRLFSLYCMVPILRFLGNYKTLPALSPKREALIKCLEDLLFINVIIPARNSFISSKSWKKTESEAQSLLSAEVLLAPLAKTANVDAGEFSLTNRTNLWIPAVPLLFSIAIQSLPRSTPKQRSLEDSWLQNLFSQLGKISYSNLTVWPHIPTLNWMLREAIDRKVRLDGSIFEPILSQVISISEEEFNSDTTMYWTLISLCLQLDPSIFIASSSIDKDSDGNPTPNMYLAFLLSRLSSIGWKSSPQGDANYDFELVKVILPLAEAFANTRNLITFVFYWRQQITICQQQLHTLHVAAPRYYRARTIWEDEKLILLLGRLIEASLTIGQIDSLCQEVLANLHPKLGDMKDVTRSATDLVFLDCIVSGLSKESHLDQLAETARSLYLSISSILSSTSDWAEEHNWRLWRILSTFNLRWSLHPHSGATKQAEQLAVKEAAELINNSINTRTKDIPRDYAKELHAFSFLLANSAAENDVVGPDNCPVLSVIETILKFGLSSCDSIRSHAAGSSTLREFAPQWNGQSDTITSVDILIIGLAAQILVFSAVLSTLNPEIQRRFFLLLYSGAVAFKRSGQSTEVRSINYLSLWQSLLGSELLKENMAVNRLFRELQVSNFLDSLNAQIATIEPYELAFSSIQHTPVRAFQRDQRNKIFRGLFRVLLWSKLPACTTIVDHISLLTEYFSVSNNPTTLLSKRRAQEQMTALPIDEEPPLMSLARKLDSDGGPAIAIPAIVAFRRLVRLTFRRCAPKIAQDGNAEYLAPFYDKLIESMISRNFQPSRQCALSTLFEAALSFYVNHLSEFPESMKVKRNNFMALRMAHFERLRAELDQMHANRSEIENPTMRSELSVMLESMNSYSDMLCDDISLGGEVSRQLSEVAAALYQLVVPEGLESLGDDESVSPDHLLVQITNLEALLGVSRRDLLPATSQAMKLLQKSKSPGERKNLLHHLRDAMAKLEPDGRTRLLEMLVRPDEKGEHLSAESLLLLQQVVLAREESKPQQQQLMGSYAMELAHAYSAICNGLLQPTGYRVCMLEMQCLDLLLQKESRVISQWHIDNTLAAIAILSSRLDATLNEEGEEEEEKTTTGMLFIGLCRIFSTILRIHRLKLGGRYHLILPALQGLLQCLFIPYSKNDNDGINNNAVVPTTAAAAISIAQGSSSSPAANSPIGEAHAAAYSRLLTTICDPTVSAVTRRPRSQKQPLNDETKKARSIAGQHLQYLLMEYCQCQLRGRLRTDMKAALTPGLHAVLDVISPEVMRTMNAAMVSSARSIFKALYEDYKRHGRWQGT